MLLLSHVLIYILHCTAFRALQYVDTQYDLGVKEADDLRLLEEMRIKCYNNLAAAQLKV